MTKTEKIEFIITLAENNPGGWLPIHEFDEIDSCMEDDSTVYYASFIRKTAMEILYGVRDAKQKDLERYP